MHRIVSLSAAVVLSFVAVATTHSDLPNLQPGTSAPAWTLTDSNGKQHSLQDFKGKYLVLEWTNHQCPVVARHYRAGGMQATQKWATEQGVAWVSVVSSKPGSQGHVTPEQANEVVKEKGHRISAMVLDPDGKVGKTYGARTTPHMFVIDPKGTLIYNGAIDDSPRGGSSAKNLVKAALEEAKAGKPVSIPVSQPYGCSVKY